MRTPLMNVLSKSIFKISSVARKLLGLSLRRPNNLPCQLQSGAFLQHKNPFFTASHIGRILFLSIVHDFPRKFWSAFSQAHVLNIEIFQEKAISRIP